MDSSTVKQTKKRRVSKACGRCALKKIRCDLRYPSCGACLAADATCFGVGARHGTAAPRSIVRALEGDIARLEKELAEARSQSTNATAIANARIDKLSARLAKSIVAPSPSAGPPHDMIPLTSPFFLSCSPVPYLNKSACSGTAAGAGETGSPDPSPSPIFVSSIARSAVDAMLKHYCEIYLYMFPAIDESDLYAACERVYNNSGPSNYDIFCVHITLAISTNTLMGVNGKRALSATRGLWATAKKHLSNVGSEDLWERLQALELLTHYAALNPQDANCVNCGGAATRLCLQMGLHRDLSDAAQQRLKIGQNELNRRKTLFWNAYGLDIAIHTTICQPFLWPEGGITTTFPQFNSESCATAHVWRLREIETEILRCLYYPHLAPDEQHRGEAFDRWFADTEARLESWLSSAQDNELLKKKIPTSEQLAQCLFLRMNRPSPRCPAPTRRMQRRTLQASIALIREYHNVDSTGRLFWLWHVAYFIIEAGVCLMACVLAELEAESACRGSSHLKHENVNIVLCCMENIPPLLDKLSCRWAEFAQHASALKAVCHLVMKQWAQWSNGNTVWNAEFHALKEKLANFSKFSPFSVSSVRPMRHCEAAPTETLPPAYDTYTSTGLTDTGQVQSLPAVQYSSTADPVTSFDQMLPLWGYDMDTASSTEQYGFMVDDEFRWDFSGLQDDEILAAMLQGSENFLWDDTGNASYV